MHNLHRELTPVSDAAWSQIEEETTRTLKRYLAGRRVVDVPSPGGIALPGVATGHLQSISAPEEGIVASLREESLSWNYGCRLNYRVMQSMTECGSDGSDWQPAKDAAKKLAYAEDRAIFNGYTERQRGEADMKTPTCHICTGSPLIERSPWEDVRRGRIVSYNHDIGWRRAFPVRFCPQPYPRS